MLNRRHFRLRTLGQLTLASVVGETETPTQVRPRHLAVLAVLAMSARSVPRDQLLAMFWGGETETRARHSLSNALSSLRSLLGPDAITSRRDHVMLAPEAQLEIDALQFAAACEAHDDERAANLYGGAFLAAVHVSDAPEFDTWVARERGKLERLFLETCERYVQTLIRLRRASNAANLAERWLDTSPRSAAAFTVLLRAIAEPGTRDALASALSAYERLCESLSEVHGVRPDASVVALAAKLRDQLSELESQPLAELPPAYASVASATRELVPARDITVRTPIVARRRTHRWRMATIGTIAAGVIVAALWMARRTPINAAESKPPIVAVTTIDDVRGDTSISWLQAGLPRMIAADLAAMGGVEVVPPSRVRDVIVRLTGSATPQLSEDQVADVAHRVGAMWAITGGVSKAQDGYLLDVTARNVKTDESESFTILAGDPIEAGRLAAGRLASMLTIGGAPRYSDVETKSAEAYRHFMRGTLAGEAEQFADAARELDAAIALDSGFIEAIRARRGIAWRVGDRATDAKLAVVATKYESRLPEIERLMDEIRAADTIGEGARADAMSERLFERYPRDPRANNFRADFLANHGRWVEADSVLTRELALDSLAMVAGDGPCAPCDVLWRLSLIRLQEGNRLGAEAAARRWVALQPDLPATWRWLSATLAATGHADEARQAGYHYVTLAHSAPADDDFARTMLAARQFSIVDSLLNAWRGTTDPILAGDLIDLRASLQRERGQFIASLETMAPLPISNGVILVRADADARVGRWAEARAIWEETGHPSTMSRTGQLTAPEARGFTWSHALEADALIRAGDTTIAPAMIDSLVAAGNQSAYGRDKQLHHHLRGLLAFARHDYPTAEREFRAAEWGVNGWTRTNVELARTLLAEHRPADAIAVLRDANSAPINAMGRYVTHSEIDWWLARAFAAAGQPDSAHVYAAYVRTAWQNADPAVKVRLDSLSR